MELVTPVEKIPKVGPVFASRLKKLRIYTLGDFLYHVPFRYENYSLISKIAQVQAGETITVQGLVREIKNEYTRRWKTIQRAKVEDQTGSIEVIWFNQPFLTKNIRPGEKISLSGKVGLFARKPVLESPDYEILNIGPIIHTGRLVPIYPETRGISSKWLRRQIYEILQKHRQNLLEYLPYSILEENSFVSLVDAIEQIHFPKTLEEAKKAKLRLAFDELFLMQLAAKQRRSEWEKNLIGYPFSISKFKKNIQDFWAKLSFELTRAQKKAVREIFGDLARSRPMNRLLEGDVGSGKTVVSAIAMYLANLNDFQSALMAPTEILAQQHYETISSLLSPFGIQVELITGSRKKGIKNQGLGIRNKARYNFDILIGTHALLSEKISFERLGLVVIDEQQRFGVEQRAIIRQKGRSPHFLTMTATPIPRTIALTLHGDLDLSFLDEMPEGRKRVKTWLIPPEKRNAAYEWIKSQIKKTNSQVFIICPFIEESETLTSVKAATEEHQRLKKEVFGGFRLGLLHGRLKAKEKQAVLVDFRAGRLDILVATPVVEVGIDISNATIIIIEGAERFGLAQLHQLRGRVGRGKKQSFCVLFTESKSQQTLGRLGALETMHVGAELAELDLKLRGPGELYGTRQHGLPTLKIASFSDFSLIEKARREAEKIFSTIINYPLLQEKLKTSTIGAVAPD